MQAEIHGNRLKPSLIRIGIAALVSHILGCVRLPSLLSPTFDSFFVFRFTENV